MEELLLVMMAGVVAFGVAGWRVATGRLGGRTLVSRDLATGAESLGMTQVDDDIFGILNGVPVSARLAYEDSDREIGTPRWTICARLHPPQQLHQEQRTEP